MGRGLGNWSVGDSMSIRPIETDGGLAYITIYYIYAYAYTTTHDKYILRGKMEKKKEE